MTNQPKHWLLFADMNDNEVQISYKSAFDLNDNKLVDDQVYRAGRRLKRIQGNHPCSRTPKLHLYDWSDSFEQETA